jgi:hypothetical protein
MDNVAVLGTARVASLLHGTAVAAPRGRTGTVEGVHFENLKVDGRAVLNARSGGGFNIDAATTRNVTFARRGTLSTTETSLPS